MRKPKYEILKIISLHPETQYFGNSLTNHQDNSIFYESSFTTSWFNRVFFGFNNKNKNVCDSLLFLVWQFSLFWYQGLFVVNIST